MQSHSQLPSYWIVEVVTLLGEKLKVGACVCGNGNDNDVTRPPFIMHASSAR